MIVQEDPTACSSLTLKWWARQKLCVYSWLISGRRGRPRFPARTYSRTFFRYQLLQPGCKSNSGYKQYSEYSRMSPYPTGSTGELVYPCRLQSSCSSSILYLMLSHTLPYGSLDWNNPFFDETSSMHVFNFLRKIKIEKNRLLKQDRPRRITWTRRQILYLACMKVV